MRKTTLASLSILLFVSFLWSCQKDSKLQIAPVTPAADHDYSYITSRVIPPVNPNWSEGKGSTSNHHFSATVPDFAISLGLVIFYDQTLSTTSVSNCAVCHRGKLAFADVMTSETRILGMNPSGTNTSSLTGLLSSAMIWSGNGISGGEEAHNTAIKNHAAMGIESMKVLPAKMAAKEYYQKLFKDAYGTEEITPERIVQALDLFLNEVPEHNANDAGFRDPFRR